MKTRNAERGTRNNRWKRTSLCRVPRSAFRLSLAGALLAGCAGPPTESADTVVVTIPRGATLDAAIDSLAARGVIRSPWLFGAYARLRGLGSGLKSGVYGLHTGAGWAEVVDALRKGRGALARFTIPEGLTLAEVADYARIQLGVPRDSFLAAARDPALLAKLGLGPGATSAEGFLYPTTYLVRVHPAAREVVRMTTDRFLAYWSPEWQARLDSLQWSRAQLVTLASIIQAEVRYAPDREYVSAVYHNRLQRGMKLEADPTVIYAYGRRLKRVFEKNLRIRSPYNTYLHAGLPPGPIGQPDTASVRAALYPAPVPFLYFVAQPDGKHIFSVTFAEHLAAIRAVHRMRTAARAQRTRGR